MGETVPDYQYRYHIKYISSDFKRTGNLRHFYDNAHLESLNKADFAFGPDNPESIDDAAVALLNDLRRDNFFINDSPLKINSSFSQEKKQLIKEMLVSELSRELGNHAVNLINFSYQYLSMTLQLIFHAAINDTQNENKYSQEDKIKKERLSLVEPGDSQISNLYKKNNKIYLSVITTSLKLTDAVNKTFGELPGKTEVLYEFKDGKFQLIEINTHNKIIRDLLLGDKPRQLAFFTQPKYKNDFLQTTTSPISSKKNKYKIEHEKNYSKILKQLDAIVEKAIQEKQGNLPTFIAETRIFLAVSAPKKSVGYHLQHLTDIQNKMQEINDYIAALSNHADPQSSEQNFVSAYLNKLNQLKFDMEDLYQNSITNIPRIPIINIKTYVSYATTQLNKLKYLAEVEGYLHTHNNSSAAANVKNYTNAISTHPDETVTSSALIKKIHNDKANIQKHFIKSYYLYIDEFVKNSTKKLTDYLFYRNNKYRRKDAFSAFFFKNTEKVRRQNYIRNLKKQLIAYRKINYSRDSIQSIRDTIFRLENTIRAGLFQFRPRQEEYTKSLRYCLLDIQDTLKSMKRDIPNLHKFLSQEKNDDRISVSRDLMAMRLNGK